MSCSRTLDGYSSFRGHLEEVLRNPHGEPRGGADTYMGASAVFLYVSCNEESTAETDQPVGGTAKVAIHELIHTMQVQMLRGQLTNFADGLDPDNDTLGVNRFQVKNFTIDGEKVCPVVYETAIKGVLDALPNWMKVFYVPTYVILVPETRGISDKEEDIQTAADELESLMFPGDDCSGGVVLGAEDVARHPAHVRAERLERLDEHAGLDGHVDAAEDLRALQRLLRAVLLAQRHQRRHFRLGDLQLAPAPLSEADVGDLVVLLRVEFLCGAHAVLLA